MTATQLDAPRPRIANAALWILASTVVIVLFYAFLDAPAVRLFAPYHHGLPAWVKIPRNIVRQYGQGLFVLAATAAIVLFDARHRRDAVRLAAGVVVGAAVVLVLKLLTGRARPDELLTGAPVFKLLEGFRNNEYQSFPSAHAASAFAFSAALAVLYRKWGWAFYTLATLCAVSRVVDIQHFPSDLAAGAALGLWAGYGAFRWNWPAAVAARVVPARYVPADGN